MVEQLQKMREKFPENQIGKLAKGSKAQTQCRADEKINCSVCGGWHHPKMIHLDYVGHAALTDRLLDVDPLWSWEPLAYRDGLPAFDEKGGLWIKLTVCGHSRIGYGNAEHSDYKEVGAREKEVIGDALRNAAMRFGAALELWHKGDLHVDDDGSGNREGDIPPGENQQTVMPQERQGKKTQDIPKGNSPILQKWLDWVDSFTSKTLDEFTVEWEKYTPAMAKLPEAEARKLQIARNEMISFLMEKEEAAKEQAQ